ncbi:hypothetical protein GQX74_014408 [Glossina fuscipes]|nr:hypothetical protein GQX74_014408 [Glossina fuscipes]
MNAHTIELLSIEYKGKPPGDYMEFHLLLCTILLSLINYFWVGIRMMSHPLDDKYRLAGLRSNQPHRKDVSKKTYSDTPDGFSTENFSSRGCLRLQLKDQDEI